MATIDERVTRVEERLDATREDVRDLRDFAAVNRKRIHDLESDRQAVKALAETIRAMPDQMHGIAREAARTVMRESAGDSRGITSVRAQVASVIVGAAGFGILLANAVGGMH